MKSNRAEGGRVLSVIQIGRILSLECGMDKEAGNTGLLRSIALFASLPDDELARIDRLCRWRNCRPRQQIIDHLDGTSDCFVIAAGTVRVVINSSAGKEITFRDMGVGEVVGELSALDGRPRPASVVALTDSRVGRLSSDSLWGILRRNPDAAATVILRLVALVRDLSDRVVAFGTLPVGTRVRAELLRLARTVGVRENRAVILRAPTHAEFASIVAARREAVTHEFARLAEAGVVIRRGRDVIVTDVAALQNSVEAFLNIATA
jgi:CRP/FNR family cyclic AMP-dependent transcriptional regulator